MHKMYILIRKDLDQFGQSYKYVQGMHAVAKYTMSTKIDPKDWDNGTMVAVGVHDELELKKWDYKLSLLKKIHVNWHEPDRDDQLTAIACIDTGEIFKKLMLG